MKMIYEYVSLRIYATYWYMYAMQKGLVAHEDNTECTPPTRP